MADIMVTLQKLANENTAKTFQYNAKEAATSRKWQEQMSNSSHQREVRDLVAAGLNPVLSAGGSGAQSYTTQSASGVADSAVNAIGNVQSSRNSAAAARYAADQSLKASQQMASAQMYAARMSYEAQKYHADMSYKQAQDFTVIGAASKAADSISIPLFGKRWNEALSSLAEDGKKIWKDNFSFAKAKTNDFKNTTDAYRSLSNAGKLQFSTMLRAAGYQVNSDTLGLVAMYAATGTDSYLWSLARYKHNKNKQSWRTGVNIPVKYRKEW